ncbi:hypothetical protein PNEG_02343 [Pneumocystis murina B123]|uniref:type I protein arginine methyltransferase n=1 Tax=Pneumocystis murina (strain B123) TaxID=1069680 RepID=M7NL59_PNEMU|nr:hypothetical protein PNEG_02343 [Pneumocystis murina B123]EMR09398.1 hypothetical protein PNEG_02343 [Pneumocystis murina B123]
MDSDSSTSVSQITENQWDDFLETEQPAAQCLFCFSKFDDTQLVYKHCKEVHAFDLQALRKHFNLDFYNTIRLINYIRDKVNKGLSPNVMAQENYVGHDIYLRPVLQDDRLLMDLEDDDDDDDNNNNYDNIHTNLKEKDNSIPNLFNEKTKSNKI